MSPARWPGALAAEDVAVVTLVPGYPAVMSKITRPSRC